MAMIFADFLLITVPAVLAFFGGWYLAARRYWWLGQLFMKEKIRRQVNERIESSEIQILYSGDMPIYSEQLLQLICDNTLPDANDLSKGKDSYTPH